MVSYLLVGRFVTVFHQVHKTTSPKNGHEKDDFRISSHFFSKICSFQELIRHIQIWKFRLGNAWNLSNFSVSQNNLFVELFQLVLHVDVIVTHSMSEGFDSPASTDQKFILDLLPPSTHPPPALRPPPSTPRDFLGISRFPTGDGAEQAGYKERWIEAHAYACANNRQ